MRLSEIQPFIAQRLGESLEFVRVGLRVYDPDRPDDGTGIVMDDGTYPKVLGREAALRDRGLCLIVGQIECGTTTDVARSGDVSFPVQVHVGIEENVKVNRGPTGTGIILEEAVQLVSEYLSGTPKPSMHTFTTSNQVFHDIENGVRLAVVTLTKTEVIRPK